MDVYIKLIKSQFPSQSHNEYTFTDADTLSDGTHLVVRDRVSMQLVFKCRLDNIDCFEKIDKFNCTQKRK